MVDFIQITTGTIMTLFTVEQVFITDTTGIHPIIPTILIPLIITATTILIITGVITHTGTIITLLMLTTIVMIIIPTLLDIEVLYQQQAIGGLKTILLFPM